MPQAFPALRLLLRLVLLLAAFELTGAAGALEIAFGSVVQDEDCCGDCPIEESGTKCPPLCPACHCSHGSVGLPQIPQPLVAERKDVEVGVELRPSGVEVPRAPPSRGVYRPPRTA